MHPASPAGSRTPVEQHEHKQPRRPQLLIAMRCLLYGIWGVATQVDSKKDPSQKAGAPSSKLLALQKHMGGPGSLPGIMPTATEPYI